MDTKSIKRNIRLLFIDGNWYMNRAWHVVNTDKDIGNALGYMMLSMICKDALRTKATHILIGFDGMSFRYNLYSEYKSARKKKTGGKSKSDETTKEIYTYMKDVQEYISRASLPFVHPRKYEADDVGAACASIASPSIKVIIATKDKDSMQLLNENVVMYNPAIKDPENPYTYASDVLKKFKVSASQMVDYQTLIGDKGDSVPNLKPFGPAKAIALLKKYGSLRNWFKKANKKGLRWINANQEDIIRNRKLVKLVTDCVDLDLDTLKVPKIVNTKDNRLPKAWHAYQAFLHPKSKGLFG